MAEPKMLAWAVSLNFGEGGPLTTSVVIAPTPEAAVAIIAVNVGRQVPAEHSLHGVGVTPVSIEWLELAVKATKGQPPEGGAQVLSLVRTEGFGPNFPAS